MEHKESPPKNEVRVTMKTRVASYLRYVYHTLEKDEEKYKEVVLKAAGRAIARLVPLVELIKRRIVGLHQQNKISSINVVDEVRGEKHERRIVMLEIVLSKEPLDTANPGYQEPLPESDVEKYQEVLETKEEGTTENTGTTRGGRGMLRAGFRGAFRGGFRGGYRGESRGGFRGGFRGGYRGESRGGYRGESRGGYRGESRGGFRGGFRGESRGGFRGAPRGGYRDEQREEWGVEHETRGDFDGAQRRDFHEGENDGEFRGGRARGGFRGTFRGGFRGGQRGGFRGGQRGGFRGGFRGAPREGRGNYNDDKQ